MWKFYCKTHHSYKSSSVLFGSVHTSHTVSGWFWYLWKVSTFTFDILCSWYKKILWFMVSFVCGCRWVFLVSSLLSQGCAQNPVNLIWSLLLKVFFFLFWLTYDGFSFIRWTGKLEGKLSLGEISHKERAAPKISRLLWSLADCHSHPLCLHGTPWLVFKHLLIASWVILKTWEGVTQTRNGESSVSKCNLCVSAEANIFHQVEL